MIWRHSTNGVDDALQIWTTTIAATNRYPTLMHDTQYRESVAWQNVGYNQPTDASFFLGATDASGTPSKAPQPNIYTVPFGQAQVNVPTCISGHVFEDANNNGIQDGSEIRINDAVVWLDSNNNGVLDSGEQSVATDAQGNYIFTGLSIGNYTIRASLSSEIPMAVESVTYSGAAVAAPDLPMQKIVYGGLITADSYTVRKNVSGNYEILLNNTLVDTLAGTLPSLTFNGLTGSDTLTIDAVNGTPIPAGGITFAGGDGADASAINFSDQIIIKGSSGADSLSVGSTSLTFNGGKVSYSGVEAVTYSHTGNPDSVTLLGTGGNDAVTLATTSSILNGSTISHTSTAAVTFLGQGASNAITVTGTSGADTVSFTTNSFTMNGATSGYSNVSAISYSDAGTNDSVTVNGGLQVSLAPSGLASLIINSLGSASIPASAAGAITARTITTLSINSGGTLILASPAIQSNRTVLVTSNLTVNGLLDLGSNDMIVHAGNVATVNTKVASAANFAAGYWNGASGITSSAAANDASKKTALGVLRNDNGSASPIYTTFDTQPAAFGDVLVKYTVYGDADLDGAVGSSDFVLLSQNFNLSSANWGKGDFNYDGKVNALDFNLIATRFGSVAPSPPVSGPVLAFASPDLFSQKTVTPNLLSLQDNPAVM